MWVRCASEDDVKWLDERKKKIDSELAEAKRLSKEASDQLHRIKLGDPEQRLERRKKPR